MGIYPSQIEVDELFNMFDQSGNEKIDFPEFLSLITKSFDKGYGKNDEDIKDAFDIFDKNDDGMITKEELYDTLRGLNV